MNTQQESGNPGPSPSTEPGGASDLPKDRTGEANHLKPLRLWPGVTIVILQFAARFGLPVFAPEAAMVGFMGGVFGGGLAIILWWLFFSRAPWSERIGAILLMVLAVLVTPFFLHESIAQGGMGMMFLIYVIPVLCLALVAWAFFSRYLAPGMRRLSMVAAIFLAAGSWTLLRTDGATGDFDNHFAWRWSATHEEQLLAAGYEKPLEVNFDEDLSQREAQWPGFLGPKRNITRRGVQIETDWTASPPSELWRRPVGPGWSSFAVLDNLIYTQEQRGDDEVVACYQLSTGEPVWRYGEKARFWESIGGAGPRGTPTISGGRVYSFGGTGILNVLDALEGTLFWSRDAATDAEAKVPIWGFSSSPLVTEDLVIVAVSGALMAYDIHTGEPRWSGPANGESYSSPQLFTIDGVDQLLNLNGAGLYSLNPADGSVLWEHAWPGFPIVQPALAANGDLLISVTATSGIRRLTVTQQSGGWNVEEHWTSKGLKPYYSEFAVHDGHAFGFDGSILSCIELENGERKWKGGRFGAGQLFLLADQGLLMVLSERGELALVEATPDQFKEVARFPAVKGKTWNHPVLVDDILLVRNAREMVAFRLSLSGS